MKTNYTIKQAHSGTTDQEIGKAKRLYRQAVKSGEMTQVNKVVLKFTDANYNTNVEYLTKDGYFSLGYKTI